MVAINRSYLDNLVKSMEWSRWKLERFRVTHLEIVRQLVGYHYGEGGSTKQVPVNLLKLMTQVYSRQLVAKNPHVMVQTPHVQLKPVAYGMELWMNHRIEEIRYADTLRRAVINALISIGIVKVGLCEYGDIEYEGWTHDIGQPYIDVIDLDDWVHEIGARRWDQITYAGHRYRMPLEQARSNPRFSRKAREKLRAASREPYNERGDERIHTITTGTEIDPEEVEENVELWEIWLPQKGRVITLPADIRGVTATTDVLEDKPWSGPEWGPYHILSFGEVPGQIMPSSPATDVLDMHELANILFRKLGDQAERQKTVLGVQGGSVDDGHRIIDAQDGQVIRMDGSPDSVREFSTGGPNQGNTGFFQFVQRMFSYLAGNLDSVGGLGAQADTVGQEQLIASRSASLVEDMQDKTMTFARDCLRSLAWYWWTDPITEYEVTKQVPGDLGISTTSIITPEDRIEADFLDLNFNIQPYSMQQATPQSQVQAMLTLMQQVIMPLMPMMEQQGMSIQLSALLRKFGHWMNIPDLEELIAFAAPPPYGQGPHDRPPSRDGNVPMPAATSRTYTRRNVSGGMSQQGLENQFMQQMMAGAQQPVVGRPPS